MVDLFASILARSGSPFEGNPVEDGVGEAAEGNACLLDVVAAVGCSWCSGSSLFCNPPPKLSLDADIVYACFFAGAGASFACFCVRLPTTEGSPIGTSASEGRLAKALALSGTDVVAVSMGLCTSCGVGDGGFSDATILGARLSFGGKGFDPSICSHSTMASGASALSARSSYHVSLIPPTPLIITTRPPADLSFLADRLLRLIGANSNHLDSSST